MEKVKVTRETVDLDAFERKIQYHFKNREYLMQALTHASYANEHKLRSNERFEFLGDSVLSLVTTHYIFSRFPTKSEGELTKMKRQLVDTNALSKYASKFDLGSYLLLGVGEEKYSGREKLSNLEDGFEALTGAIFLDGGYDAVSKFVTRYISEEVNIIDNYHRLSDPKTMLQEKVQETPGEILEYEIIDESGPDHDKVFTCVAKINSNVFGTGVGRSKKKAEAEAARKALEVLGIVIERD